MPEGGKRVVSVTAWLFSGVLLVVGTTPVFAATPAMRDACSGCEEATRFVRLQTASADKGSGASGCCTHPFVLDRADWRTILSALRVQRQAEGLFMPVPPGPVVSVFTKDDLDYLSASLSHAFAHAQPTEWVVFGLSHPTPHGLTELTTGGAYVEGPLVHIVLANMQKVVGMPATRQLLWAQPLRPESGPAYKFVAGNHQTIVRDPQAGWSPFARTADEVSIAYQALLLGEPPSPADSQVTGAVDLSHDFSSSGDRSPVSIDDRLRVLKRLHTQGLITDEDYRVKKEQLLKDF